MSGSKQFKKPPLVEVFCEFFFQGAEGGDWDSFLVPSFYKRIKADFPTRKPLAVVGIEIKQAQTGTGPHVRVSPPLPRHQFISANGKTLVQLGDNLLVVNQLPPYYGWEKFEPAVKDCFKVYADLWKPRSVARTAVHYIDKVDIPKADIRIEDYFTLYPSRPAFPDSPATNLAMAYEVRGASEGDILAVTMRQHPSAHPEGISFLFQWDYVATGELAPDPALVAQWLNRAHLFLREVFLGTFTKECLKLFDQEDN